MKYNLDQNVVLTRDIPETELKKGDVATVVEHRSVPGEEDVYSLKVLNALGDTIAVAHVRESQIESLRADEVFSVRTLMMSAQNDFHLYHYTTPEGLRKIVEEGEIWASNIFFLNDSEEWYWGMKLFADRLKDRKADHPIFEEYLLAAEKAMVGEEQGGLDPQRYLGMHVCSFSKNGDLLSQWRAYCPKGGFALGFPKSKLALLAQDQGFVLDRCVYEHEDHLRMIDAMLDRIRDEAKLKDSWHPNSASLRTEYGGIINRFNWEIWKTAAIMKHWGFHEELEWRFVSSLKSPGASGNLGFHTSGGTIVPHQLIDLNSNPALWNDVSVVVGPGPHKEKSVHVVRNLLWDKKKVMTARIRPSTIPYRNRSP